MKTTWMLKAALTCAVVCAAAVVFIHRHPDTRTGQIPAPKPAQSAEPAQVVEVVPSPNPAPMPELAQSDPAPQTPIETSQPQPLPSPAQSNKPRAAKPPLQDPVARLALALVGADPSAEAYWFDAINDSDLPAGERQDLIEDLNEEGLTDPKHPSPEDLPVIWSRLQILESMEPMDKANADAMAEAHKDLLNLLTLAAGMGGKPVR
jgi:hypothetical protein